MVATNILSLLSIVLITLTIIIDRRHIRRVFMSFIIYHVIVLIYNIVGTIGAPPNNCFSMIFYLLY